MRVKVHKGTPFHGDSLCKTCRMAVIMEGPGKRETFCHNLCGAVGSTYQVKYPVYSCTCYEDKSTPTRYDMEQIAWRLCTDEKKEFIGFKPPPKEKYHSAE